ncbi:kinase-like protein [Periconia macrospinosa]|uniref:Kinase-like protein n=1 Tax=Periconia macrospinosa TaxID=97972 RepID=A0A2V1D2R9_9PLEO|nr:kinase-like protein [Periconia macrospinosa]
MASNRSKNCYDFRPAWEVDCEYTVGTRIAEGKEIYNITIRDMVTTCCLPDSKSRPACVIKKIRKAQEAISERTFHEIFQTDRIRDSQSIAKAYLGFYTKDAGAPKTYCLISKKYDFDLYSYMSNNDSTMNKKQFFHELYNLAGALATIHIPGPGYFGVHHDLKPHNILVELGANSTVRRLLITDFGHSKIQRGSHPFCVNQAQDSDAAYFPPEYRGGSVMNWESDIWALGCVFFEMSIWQKLGKIQFNRFTRSKDRLPDSNMALNGDLAKPVHKFFGRIRDKNIDKSWEEVMSLIKNDMMNTNPTDRMDADEISCQLRLIAGQSR